MAGYLKKPGIPSTPAGKEDRSRFDAAMRECVESIMGRNTTRIKPLDTATATLADCVAKINELVYMLQ